MRDLLGCDRAIADDALYRCLDKLLAHKQAFFSYLRARWAALFDARFDVLLYDLTSTYFESDPAFEDKRRFGYSRDRRPDCVQVVIALILTPEGFPLAYEVMPGNTVDRTTLTDFLEKIERQYGRSDRVWIMDRGIPTEETLASMRDGDAPVRYLVGTPKGRLTRLETAFLELPWQEVRQSVDVTLVAITGGKHVPDADTVWTTLDRTRAKYGDMVLLHGGGPGVEKIAASWAEARGVSQVICRPDWNAHGKAAPFRRNDDLLNLLPKGVIAFPGSGITGNLVDKARQLGIPVYNVA